MRSMAATSAALWRGRLGRTEASLMRADLAVAWAEVEYLETLIDQTPDRLRLADVQPEARLLTPESRLLSHAIRMSAFNAESALARLLSPFYRRAQDERRAILREAFRFAGHLRVTNGHLEVRLNTLSAPRRTAALAELCQALTDTETVYPGTNLVIRYSVKSAA
jgi:hypothetical protein